MCLGVQITTIGFGDVTPATPTEVAVTIGVQLVGVLFFGVLLGSMAQLLQARRPQGGQALYRFLSFLCKPRPGSLICWPLDGLTYAVHLPEHALSNQGLNKIRNVEG